MRWLLLLGLLGCHTSHAIPSPDAPVQIDAPLGNTFGVPVGEPCEPDPAMLCAGGTAVCFNHVCRNWCGSPPKCASGFVEVKFGVNLCACVPG